MKNHFYSLVFLVFCLVVLSVGLGTQTKALGQKQEIPTVAFCDLMNQPAKYYGKLVRIRATIVTGIDWQLLASRDCEHQGADPAFPDCSEDSECEAALKQMRANIDFKGDIWRVEVIVVGELEVSPPSSSSRSTSPPNFIIKTIENSFKIPHKDSWP